jgi:hypothetical protein
MLALFVGIALAAVCDQPATRAQPHVLLESGPGWLNTFKTPEWHEDPKHVKHGDDVRQEYIVQLKRPATTSRTKIGARGVSLCTP